MKLISRRKMLGTTSCMGAMLAVDLPPGAKSANAADGGSATPKPKVIVTGGHPGDPEYGCGGTMARLANSGHEVVLLYLNQGDPRAESVEKASGIRVEEAKKACEILRARPAYAGQIDGKAVVDAPHYQQFLRLLEAEQPNVVFTHWPIDN